MRVAMLTREYPPEIYGGAGVHVDFLTRRLRGLVELEVHCFGAPRSDARASAPDPRLADANAALQTLSVDLEMAAALDRPDVVHSHTWYANFAGHVGALVRGVPHVLTAHSLEPRRPWKAEQLGGGYAVSSWAERTAYEGAAAVIAVSNGMREDLLDAYPFVDPARVHVIYNGVDTELYAPDPSPGVLTEVGIDPSRAYVLFVGRITRQKGLPHLLAAAHSLEPGVQVVISAGSPDTAELGAEVAEAVAKLQAAREGVFWVQRMLPREELVQLLSSAAVFVCPSVYEPLGIVNLEAMACGTPVVASAVGGIPEVVDDGHTGLLVPYDAAAPERFEAMLAERVNELIDDPRRAAAMGEAGRRRVQERFDWGAVARQTAQVYDRVVAGS